MDTFCKCFYITQEVLNEALVSVNRQSKARFRVFFKDLMAQLEEET